MRSPRGAFHSAVAGWACAPEVPAWTLRLLTNENYARVPDAPLVLCCWVSFERTVASRWHRSRSLSPRNLYRLQLGVVRRRGDSGFLVLALRGRVRTGME